MRRAVLLAFVVVGGLGACSTAHGEVSIDGETHTFTSCRSGAVYGFRGVELTASSGVRLRIAATPAGEAGLVIVRRGATAGREIGPCGTLTLVDRKRSIAGRATLDCTADGTTIRGAVRFDHCR